MRKGIVLMIALASLIISTISQDATAYYYRGRHYPYRYRGHYYSYRYHGMYFRHRYYRHGRWHYY